MFNPTVLCELCHQPMVEHIIDARSPNGMPSEVSCVFGKNGTPNAKCVRTLVVSYNMLTSAVRAPAPTPPPVDQTVVAERATLHTQVGELGMTIASQRTAIQGFRTEIENLQDELAEVRANAGSDTASYYEGVVTSLNAQIDALKLENAQRAATIEELNEHIECLTGSDNTEETEESQTT